MVTLLYVAANVAYLNVLPLSGMQHAPEDRVATAVATALFGPAAAGAIAAAIMVSTFGCVNGLVLSGARVSFAMARDGLFFHSLERVNGAGVPGNALWAQAAWASLLVLSGNYNALLKYVISVDLVFFVLLVLAVIVLRRKRPDLPRPFRAPGYPFLPLLYAAGGIALIVILLYGNPKTTWPGYALVAAGRARVRLLAAPGGADVVTAAGDPVVYDVAEGALVVEYPGLSDGPANRAAVALGAELLGSALEGLRDAVPGARTLSLFFDPQVLGHDALRREALSRGARPSPPEAPRTFAIGVLYGGEMGPDLAELSASAGRTPEEFARDHAAGEYTAAFLGFAPGFAYLTGLDPALHAPRLATPRPRVPAGSVAIGGPYTGIYPRRRPAAGG